jgi:hypothetical protein
MRTLFLLSLVPAATLLLASPGAAQLTPGREPDRTRDSTARVESAERQRQASAVWSVEAMPGHTTDGPANDLIDAMRVSGFDDRLCSIVGCADFPTKGSKLLGGLWVAARHRLGAGPIHVGLAGGATEFREVRGSHLSPAPGFSLFSLSTDSKVNVFAAMAWLEVTPEIRIGAGPSLNRASVRFGTSGAPDKGTFRRTTAGYIAEIAVSVPSNTHIYVTGLAQYRGSGSLRVEGWTKTLDSGASLVFAPTNVRTSHRLLGIGVGGRF